MTIEAQNAFNSSQTESCQTHEGPLSQDRIATKVGDLADFTLYVRDDARTYKREFREHLYDAWHRLYEIPRGEKQRPWKFRQLTLIQVYKPLANSNGEVLCLLRVRRRTNGKPGTALHQFLSEEGVKVLRAHLDQLLAIASTSTNREEYEAQFEKLFGQQPPTKHKSQSRMACAKVFPIH